MVQLDDIKPYTPLSGQNRHLLDSLSEKARKGRYRPKHHIVPPCGLLNDPNGLCFFGGKYHVFYQWYPFASRHDMKHWNHVSSPDLINWSAEDEILVPNRPYEKNGCYSGNAFVDSENDECYLYYTANFKDEKGRKIPKQALALMNPNGAITKFGNNPIIDGSPDGIGGNIRDPFVFNYDGKYLMFIGAETINNKGTVLLYESDDLKSWKYEGEVSVLLNGKKLDLGSIVECPGIIRVGDEDVLFLSLIGSNLKEVDHPNRFTSIGLVGKLNLKKRVFEAKSLQTLDYGFDYYAPQPFYGENGEPMMFAWFGCGDQKLPDDEYGWRHGLTMPRLINVEDGKILTPPHPDVASQFEFVEVKEPNPGFIKDNGNPTHLVWRLKNDNETHYLKIGQDDDYWSLVIDFKTEKAIVDRSTLKEKVDEEYGMTRESPLPLEEDLTVDVFLDNSFNEIYLNEGQSLFSFRSYQEALN